MAPWEKYAAQPATDGPWAKYGGSAPKVGMMEDVAKSAGTGLLRGGFDVAGTIADLNDAAGAGVGWLMGKAGAAPQDVEAAKAGPLGLLRPFMAGSQQIEKGVESVTGELYDPKTTAGEFAQTGARFVPGALTGGSARQAVGSAVKYGLAPGLASEAAGQLTKGTELEPWARAGTALATGTAAGAVGDATTAAGANRQILRNAPTRDDLVQQRDAAYGASRAGGAAFDPNSVNLLPARIRQSLNNQNMVLDDTLTPSAYRAANDIERLAALPPGRPVPLEEIVQQRRRFQTYWDHIPAPSPLAPNAGREERRVMAAMQREFDDWVDNVSGTALVHGSPDAVEAFREGNRLHSLVSKNDSVQRAIQKGVDRAARSGSGGNENNAIRQEVGKILDRAPGLTADERAILRRAAEGSRLQDVLRAVGGLSPTTGKLQTLLAGGAAYAEPTIGIPAAIVGYGAKTLADRSTRRNADVVAALMRSGGQRPPNLSIQDRRALAIALGGGQSLRPTE
jgi:hypothetical protein